MERESFEDKLKASFKDAEISPSENVWTNLELELAKAESNAMKRRIVYFKLLAAASVIFALSVAGASIYYLNNAANERASLFQAGSQKTSDSSRKPTAEADKERGTESKGNTMTDENAEDPAEQNEAVIPHQQSSVTFTPAGNISADHISSFSNPSESFSIADGGLMERLNMNELDKNRLNGLVSNNRIEIVFTKKPAETDPVEAMMARLALREQQIQRESKEEKKKTDNPGEKLWTSLGFAAGTFSSVSSGVSQPVASAATFSSAAPSTKNEAKASGQSYTVGLNVGTKISERWVVQGGVNYLTQLSDYTAQAVVGTSDFQSFRPVSTNELEKMNDETTRANSRVVSTAPYNVNNNVKYLSIPVQAGYMLVNKKLGVQLNAGVSTDLFLQNTKTAEGDNIDRIDQGIGEDSPYRPMNFSGLVGTELSYRFGNHYRIAFNPGVRYPFSSIYKSNLGVQSTPLTFDVGLRFRYIFH